MTQTVARTAPATTDRRSSASRLVVSASLVAVAADHALMGVVGEIIPPLLVLGAITVAAAALAARRPAAGAATLGVIAIVALIGSAPFLANDLTTPTDPIAFVWAVLSGGGRLAVLIGAALALLRRDALARPVALAALAVLVLAVGGSLIARATVATDSPAPGDVEVVAAGFAYPSTVTVPAGGALYVENRDLVHHDLAVEGTDLHVLVEPRTAKRVGIDLPAGAYTFLCTVPGHEAMVGTLEVSG